MRNALASGVDTAFSALAEGFEKSAADFKSSLSAISDGLQETLLSDMNRNFDDILGKLDEKDKSIGELNAYMGFLDKSLVEVRS